jgi:ribonuclease E
LSILGQPSRFLAFSEIHPDYYQIPKEDREALLAEEAAHAEEEAALRAVAEGEEDFRRR